MLKKLCYLNFGLVFFTIIYLAVLMFGQDGPGQNFAQELRSLGFYLIFCLPPAMLAATGYDTQPRWILYFYVFYLAVLTLALLSIFFMTGSSLASLLFTLVAPLSFLVSIMVLAIHLLGSAKK